MSVYSQAPAPAVSASEAFGLLADDSILIDVREPNEWQAGHASMAISMPMSTLGATAGTLSRTTLLILVCRSGRRSDAAVNALIGAGFNAVNLAGGMQAWQLAGLDVVRDDGTPGSVI